MWTIESYLKNYATEYEEKYLDLQNDINSFQNRIKHCKKEIQKISETSNQTYFDTAMQDYERQKEYLQERVEHLQEQILYLHQVLNDFEQKRPDLLQTYSVDFLLLAQQKLQKRLYNFQFALDTETTRLSQLIKPVLDPNICKAQREQAILSLENSIRKLQEEIESAQREQTKISCFLTAQAKEELDEIAEPVRD